MEIISEPYNLNLTNEQDRCQCCDLILEKEIKKGNYLIGNECGYCRYLDRPFGGCGNTALSHYGGCTCEYTCEYGEKDYIYISCKNCKEPKCLKCKTKLNCCNNNCNKIICNSCENKIKFNNVWKTKTPQEKLKLYGSEKLKILAKKKNIKGYSKYNKDELFTVLAELVDENDFPIK
jgi:hypothetical protein